MTKQEYKQAVLDMALRCYGEGLFAGTSGNLSAFDREAGLMYITPSSRPYETMTADDIMVITLDGEVVDGPHSPSSEWRMHAAVYREKPEVGAVVHTHSPYATGFAVTRSSIPVILLEMVYFLGDDVPLADFAIPGTDAVGDSAVRALRGRYSCLMANHGVLEVGDDVQQAHLRAVYVEDAARIYNHALATGLPPVVVSEQEIRRMRET